MGIAEMVLIGLAASVALCITVCSFAITFVVCLLIKDALSNEY